MPVLTLCIFVFVIWLHYENSKTNKKAKEISNAFWSREAKSTETRKADISNLNYIEIPLDQLPLTDTSDERLLSYQEKVKALAHNKILNLTGITNTELKINYGVANFPLLSEYDENYIRLMQTINSWANYLYEINHLEEARQVLEFGITCGTDISNIYLLLGKIYKELEDYYALSQLIEHAKQQNPLLNLNIITKLNDLKLS